MRARWFLLGFLAGALLSFIVYYSAQHATRAQAKTEEPRPATAAPGTPAALTQIGSPIAGLKRSELRDSFNEIHFGHKHEAIDIMEPRGTPVLAVTDGAIAKLLRSKAGGNMIYQFDTAATYCYYYAHLDHYAEGIADGVEVTRGEVIAYVGSSGNASPDAPHLHFGVSLVGPERKWSGGTPVDPYPLLLRAAK